MANDSILFSTLIEGLAALNQRVLDLEGDSDEIKKEILSFQNEYTREIGLINSRVDDVNVQVFKQIQEEIAKIVVKDGVDGKNYDADVARALIKAEISKLTKQRDLEVTKIKDEVLQAVSEIEVPKGEQGEDGKSVTDAQISSYIDIWLNDNIDTLKGSDGKSIVGATGRSGSDGISITDVKIVKGYLVISFSDDTEKRVKMPIQSSGGVGNLNQPKNFSYDTINEGINIPLYQQMIVHGGINIENTLVIDGSLILEP